jgi:hypothetical protein
LAAPCSTAYVINGLLYHEADLSIGTHHTDGGAVGLASIVLAASMSSSVSFGGRPPLRPRSEAFAPAVAA